MNINRNLKVIFIIIALISASLSVFITAYKPVNSTSTTVSYIKQESGIREKLDGITGQIRNEISDSSIDSAYTNAFADTPDHTSEIAAKKAELVSLAEAIKTEAKDFDKDMDKISQTEALDLDERTKMITEHEKYASIREKLSKCEALKNEINAAVQKYEEEQAAKKKAEEDAAAARKKQNSGSKKNSGNSQNKSSSSGSSGNSSSSGSSSGSSSSDSSYSSDFSSSGRGSSGGSSGNSGGSGGSSRSSSSGSSSSGSSSYGSSSYGSSSSSGASSGSSSAGNSSGSSGGSSNFGGSD